MIELHVFGVANPAGAALRQLASDILPEWPLIVYSRNPSGYNQGSHHVDFLCPKSFRPAGKARNPQIWISFGPIWLLAPFLKELASHDPQQLQHLRGVIACSSSSVITKRFAANHFDRKLVARLSGSEEVLLATCRRLQVSCQILQPTLIYGQVGDYEDRNISRLLQLMRRLPFLPVPSETGLRQPIHASQLAAVALHLAQEVSAAGLKPFLSERIALGGDSSLSYSDMLRAMQQNQPVGDPARRCRLLPIPNRLFFSLASPLLLSFPKAFEAVLRISANLSDFTPAHQVLGIEPQPFPVRPVF